MNDSDIFSIPPCEPVSLTDKWESIVPVRDQILVRPDKPSKQTKGGIVLPDSVRMLVFRGRVLAVSYTIHRSYDMAEVPDEHRVEVGDRIVFHWANAMPQDLEADETNVLISFANVLAKIKQEKNKCRST